MTTPASSSRAAFAWRFALFALPLASAACVRVETYDDAIFQLNAARNDAAQKGAQVAALSAESQRLGIEVMRLNAEMGRLAKDAQARDAKLAEMTVARANDQKRVDDLMALNSELSQRLKSVGHSVETLSGEKGALAKALADTKQRLDELRRQQAAAEARAAQFRELAARFQKLVDAGQLKVVMRGGRMLLELSNDILFDSARTEVKEGGRRTLGEIARVLRTMPERRFQVAGHTDNVKIATPRFPSNWELSTARAIEVVKLLIEGGMDARALSAAGYGEFAPVAGNDASEGRAKNRRIEIALVPNLEELVSVPGAEAAPSPPPPPHASRR
ncbi:Flagellar motor rotation protein MotB [Minicystis rosea]|nr:Flagellar motor rotation protein MotB [Minicystis rosea]